MMMKKETRIFNKRFDDLSSEEKLEHLELFENEAEFEQVKRTLLQLENMEQIDVLQPNPKKKDELMAQFHEKWNEKAIPWHEKLGNFFLNPGKPLFFKPVFQITVGLALVFLFIQLMSKMEEKALVADNTTVSKEVESMPVQKEMKPIKPTSPTEISPKTRYAPPVNQEISTDDAVATPSPVMISSEATISTRTLMLAEASKKAEANAEREGIVSTASASGFLHSDWIDQDDVKSKEKSNSSAMNVSFNKDELQLLDLLEPAF